MPEIGRVVVHDHADNPGGGTIAAAALSGILTTRGDMLRRGASAVERLALGTNGQVVQSDGTDILYGAAGAGAVTREGGNTTEATTTSTSDVDLLTTSSLTIAVGEPFIAFASIRKTTGAAAGVNAGVKLNATEVIATHLWSTSSNQNDSGVWMYESGGRGANYLRPGHLTLSSGGQGSLLHIPQDGGDAPNAQITDIIVRAKVDNAAITMAADDMHVYSFSTS